MTGSDGVAAVPDEAIEAAAEAIEAKGYRMSRGYISSRDIAQIIAAATPAVRAAVLREAADAARGMHDPPALDCVEWADWLDARAAAGGSPEVDNNESEDRDA